MIDFRTHTGEIVRGDRLVAACEKVANDLIKLANDIRKEDAYANHVSEEMKDQILADDLQFAESVRIGKQFSVTIWQRVNTELTGECVALLP